MDVLGITEKPRSSIRKGTSSATCDAPRYFTTLIRRVARCRRGSLPDRRARFLGNAQHVHEIESRGFEPASFVWGQRPGRDAGGKGILPRVIDPGFRHGGIRSEEHTSELQS